MENTATLADAISIAISLLALVVSGFTAWLTLFSRGQIRMTKPSYVCFSYDNGRKPRYLDEVIPQVAKIFLRSVIYTTGQRGHVVENMFVNVQRGMEKQVFNIWGHTVDGELSRGSGLFVGPTGVTENHHFNPITALPQQFFIPGDYQLDVFAVLAGKKKPVRLSILKLTVPENARHDMLRGDARISFNWEQEKNAYHAHVDT